MLFVEGLLERFDCAVSFGEPTHVDVVLGLKRRHSDQPDLGPLLGHLLDDHQLALLRHEDVHGRKVEVLLAD